MKFSFLKAWFDMNCQKCGKKINTVPKNIGLDCLDLSNIYLECKHIIKFDSNENKRIFEKRMEKLGNNNFFYTMPPRMVHLCLDCYLDLIDWFGIPEYDTIGIQTDLDKA